MQKPIEPGCLVVFINSMFPENIGRTGTVIEIDHTDDPRGDVHVDGYFKGTVHDSGPCWTRRENLRRIDGGDPDATQEENQDQEVPSDALA
ncbi:MULTISPECIES: hypothetical protein [Halomonadaceae]|uniref:Uncharacterized protein n=1 Tax=Halomonas hydrothermalis TaxID=115561 RepID=A0A6F8U002_9GAMM|nr:MULTISPECIES: hypothetical protein [Halomonas]UTD54945.1 hypothetical protein NF683_17630 [Halomonas sp. MS1]BCB06772.1 hypothetical protein HHSLTHF2_06620 [Halomonas hydrothermalis]